MCNDAGLGFAFGRWHLPLISCSLDQHLARYGTALANVLLRTTNATTAARRHVSPDTTARQILSRGRVFGFHLLPVALEFFGDKLSETSQGALTHFRARNADDDLIIPFDKYPRTHLVAFGTKCLLRQCTPDGGQVQSQYQTAASGCA